MINGLVMEYKFPTECCNLPTNLALSAIYWQVVGAVKDQRCSKHWVQSQVERRRHAKQPGIAEHSQAGLSQAAAVTRGYCEGT